MIIPQFWIFTRYSDSGRNQAQGQSETLLRPGMSHKPGNEKKENFWDRGVIWIWVTQQSYSYKENIEGGVYTLSWTNHSLCSAHVSAVKLISFFVCWNIGLQCLINSLKVRIHYHLQMSLLPGFSLSGLQEMTKDRNCKDKDQCNTLNSLTRTGHTLCSMGKATVRPQTQLQKTNVRK